MRIIEVPGATGNYDTNFAGKADAALEALLGGLDFVYIHMEAPDECGHQGDVAHKIYSIEQIDQKVVARLCEGLYAAGELVGGVFGANFPPSSGVGWALTSGMLAGESIVNAIQ